ncbi:hypothetical protein [Haladaptatus caseinilyticus]
MHAWQYHEFGDADHGTTFTRWGLDDSPTDCYTPNVCSTGRERTV